MTSPLPRIDQLTYEQLVELQRAWYVEQNKRQGQHVMAEDCWCQPETVFIDPASGVKVIVHRGPQ